MEQQIEKFIEQYHAFVFLVTEDGNVYDDLRNKFGEYIKIVSYDSFIYDYDGKDVLSRSNVLEDNKKLRGQKYLVKMILLSRCKYLISSITQGSKFSYGYAFLIIRYVEYIHESILENRFVMSKQYFLRKIYRVLTRKKNYMDKFKMESKLNPFFNKSGLFFCENGYMEPHLNIKKPIYIEGYFQSQKYFNEIKADLLTLFDGSQFPDYDKYPGLYKLRERNSVCISVKVEHNVGSSMYDVCSMKYWEEAIQYVIKNVDNPLFFICSDNVDYVLEHLIDASKYDYVVQDKNKPVYVSLAAMSECKNFIIGNTTFGWWAQYLAKANKKIVVAPSKWMSVDMPIDLYEDSWHLIEV